LKFCALYFKLGFKSFSVNTILLLLLLPPLPTYLTATTTVTTTTTLSNQPIFHKLFRVKQGLLKEIFRIAAGFFLHCHPTNSIKALVLYPYTSYTHLIAVSKITWVSQYQNYQVLLDYSAAKDDGVGSGDEWNF